MMAVNGRAHEARPVDLGILLPERRDVKVNEVTYQAWVTSNKRYPRRVQAMLDAALARYLRVAGPLLRMAGRESDAGADEPLTEEQIQALDEHDIAYQDYLTEAISALVPDLATADPEAIEIMRTEQALLLLQELGYMPEPKKETADQPDAEREASNPDEEGAPLTGSRRPRASRKPTPDSPSPRTS